AFLEVVAGLKLVGLRQQPVQLVTGRQVLRLSVAVLPLGFPGYACDRLGVFRHADINPDQLAVASNQLRDALTAKSRSELVGVLVEAGDGRISLRVAGRQSLAILGWKELSCNPDPGPVDQRRSHRPIISIAISSSSRISHLPQTGQMPLRLPGEDA